MSSLFKTKTPDYTPPPTIAHEQVQAQADAQRRRSRAAKGRASTMLTGGSGLVDSTAGANTLLGQ